MKGEVKLTGTKKRMCSANFCGAGSTIIGSISLLHFFFINVLPPIFPSLFRFQILSRPLVSPGGWVGDSLHYTPRECISDECPTRGCQRTIFFPAEEALSN